jgi:hypothetical protein
MPDLSDITLTNDGLAPLGRGRVLIVACGALAHEIIALKRLNGWDHVDLQCLPAILHNHPERITDAVEAAVTENRHAYDQIMVAYAECDELGVDYIAGPHCYSFFETNAVFEAHGEVTAFYLTDFLARQFDAFVWKPLGLDRHPDLLSMYFGNYEKLVYLAQTDDPALTAKAEDCATRMGLAFERRFTGYGDLATAIAKAAAD